MDFAVIKTGGKQYVVKSGDTITIEKLQGVKGDLQKGDAVTFSDVLLTDNGTKTTIGAPVISGASVTGTVSMIGRAQKIDVVKYKAKSRYFKRNGHRQPFVKVKIEKVG
jgi:large subunit ribosomal protein L21